MEFFLFTIRHYVSFWVNGSREMAKLLNVRRKQLVCSQLLALIR